MAGGTSLALYMEPEDFDALKARVDWDPELAWITRGGGGRWIASRTLESEPAWRSCIWHIPGGPLPLVVPAPRPGLPRRVEEAGDIADPFAGWDDPFRGRTEAPAFGDPPCVFWLKLCVRNGPGSQTGQSEIGLSTLGWIGNRYAATMQAPARSTSRNWARLRKWIDGNALRIGRSGEIDIDKPGRLDVFAFPAALAAIRSGVPRMVNPPLQRP